MAIGNMVVYSLSNPPHVGLLLHLLRSGYAAQSSPGIQPLLVRLELVSPGPPRLSVDGRPVSWEDFPAVLQKELTLRPPNWPVYLEGAPSMDWLWAGKAIDTIRGLQADVVLLTIRSPSPKDHIRRTRFPAPGNLPR